MGELKHNALVYRVIRLIFRIAHRYNWHYAPPIYPEGDTQLWCKWCGFRQTIKRRTRTIEELEAILNSNESLTVKIEPDGSISAESQP